jgi:hypothetical protein
VYRNLKESELGPRCGDKCNNVNFIHLENHVVALARRILTPPVHHTITFFFFFFFFFQPSRNSSSSSSPYHYKFECPKLRRSINEQLVQITAVPRGAPYHQAHLNRQPFAQHIQFLHNALHLGTDTGSEVFTQLLPGSPGPLGPSAVRRSLGIFLMSPPRIKMDLVSAQSASDRLLPSK